MGERFSAPTFSLGNFQAICQLFNDLSAFVCICQLFNDFPANNKQSTL